jgi:hypothetical protein
MGVCAREFRLFLDSTTEKLLCVCITPLQDADYPKQVQGVVLFRGRAQHQRQFVFGTLEISSGKRLSGNLQPGSRHILGK